MYAVTNYLDISTNSTLLIMLALALITFLNILGIKKVKAFQTPILALTTSSNCACMYHPTFRLKHRFLYTNRRRF